MGFKEELEHLINTHSLENESDTPDFMLAEYILDCLRAYTKAVHARDKWYGDYRWVSEVTPSEEV